MPDECTLHSLRAEPPAVGFLVPSCTLSFPEQNTSKLCWVLERRLLKNKYFGDVIEYSLPEEAEQEVKWQIESALSPSPSKSLQKHAGGLREGGGRGGVWPTGSCFPAPSLPARDSQHPPAHWVVLWAACAHFLSLLKDGSRKIPS